MIFKQFSEFIGFYIFLLENLAKALAEKKIKTKENKKGQATPKNKEKKKRKERLAKAIRPTKEKKKIQRNKEHY